MVPASLEEKLKFGVVSVVVPMCDALERIGAVTSGIVVMALSMVVLANAEPEQFELVYSEI
jgi:hypothetical protein